jgi:hypothetical protein
VDGCEDYTYPWKTAQYKGTGATGLTQRIVRRGLAFTKIPTNFSANELIPRPPPIFDVFLRNELHSEKVTAHLSYRVKRKAHLGCMGSVKEMERLVNARNIGYDARKG